eukprot:2698518-Alexandrium_andersonii.AAC.1
MCIRDRSRVICRWMRIRARSEVMARAIMRMQVRTRTGMLMIRRTIPINGRIVRATSEIPTRMATA